MSNTDAIIIGGTDNVTEDNVIHLMSKSKTLSITTCIRSLKC